MMPRTKESRALWLTVMAERYGEMLTMDGYDDCIAGVCLTPGKKPVIVYDQKKVIRKLMADGMSYNEAQDFHQYNQAETYMGDRTPAFLVTE